MRCNSVPREGGVTVDVLLILLVRTSSMCYYFMFSHWGELQRRAICGRCLEETTVLGQV